MTTCDSTYTIDRRAGEKLTCILEVHAAAGFRGVVHVADYADNQWYWSDREADNARDSEV